MCYVMTWIMNDFIYYYRLLKKLFTNNCSLIVLTDVSKVLHI